jgi:hypothetical protein
MQSFSRPVACRQQATGGPVRQTGLRQDHVHTCVQQASEKQVAQQYANQQPVGRHVQGNIRELTATVTAAATADALQFS